MSIEQRIHTALYQHWSTGRYKLPRDDYVTERIMSEIEKIYLTKELPPHDSSHEELVAEWEIIKTVLQQTSLIERKTSPYKFIRDYKELGCAS